MDSWEEYLDGSHDYYNITEMTETFQNATQFMKPESYSKSNPLDLGGLGEETLDYFSTCFYELMMTDQDPIDISIIKPSLRLASRLLQSDRTNAFFATILGSSRSRWTSYKKNFVIWENKHERHLTGVETKPSEWNPDRNVPESEGLYALFYIIVMIRYKQVRYRFCPDTQCARTEQTVDNDWREFARDQVDFPCWGYKSEVYLPRQTYDDLAAATAAVPEDTALLLYLRFELAITVLHELAHAARNCLDGKKDMEPYFGRNPIAELGFELESWLFDGILTRMFSDGDLSSLRLYKQGTRNSKLQGVLVLWEYPNQGIVADYKGFGEEQRGVERRGLPKDLKALDLAWRVPVKFLEKFFQDEFWDSSPAPEDFHPERRSGYLFRVDETPGNNNERIPVITPLVIGNYVTDDYLYNNVGDILLRRNGTPHRDVVKERLGLDQTTPPYRLDPVIFPYEPGGEYDKLSFAEVQRRRFVHILGEDISIIQPGGKYAEAGRGTLFTEGIVDGLMRLPEPYLFQPHERLSAGRYWSSLSKYQKSLLATRIAECNTRFYAQRRDLTQDQTMSDAHDFGDDLIVQGKYQIILDGQSYDSNVDGHQSTAFQRALFAGAIGYVMIFDRFRGRPRRPGQSLEGVAAEDYLRKGEPGPRPYFFEERLFFENAYESDTYIGRLAREIRQRTGQIPSDAAAEAYVERDSKSMRLSAEPEAQAIPQGEVEQGDVATAQARLQTRIVQENWSETESESSTGRPDGQEGYDAPFKGPVTTWEIPPQSVSKFLTTRIMPPLPQEDWRTEEYPTQSTPQSPQQWTTTIVEYPTRSQSQSTISNAESQSQDVNNRNSDRVLDGRISRIRLPGRSRGFRSDLRSEVMQRSFDYDGAIDERDARLAQARNARRASMTVAELVADDVREQREADAQRRQDEQDDDHGSDDVEMS